MKQILKMLIVDDHPAMIEGYKSIFSISKFENQLEISSALDCESAFNVITNPGASFDVALLDISLPGYASEHLESGEDLALLIQKTIPNCKIILLTSHAETFMLYNLVKKTNPDGLLVKSDFKSDELLSALENVLDGGSYYSATVRQGLKTMQSNDIYLDTLNRRIISLLAKGIQTKNLPSHLKLSLSAVDKRKAQIKEILNIEKGSDEDIIRQAQINGFI